MEGTIIMVLCAVGLVLVLAYMIYRISSHRKKMNRLYDLSREIGSSVPMKGSGRIDRGAKVTDPVIPEKDLIVLFHRNGNRAWADVFRRRTRGGGPGLLVTSDPPKKGDVGGPDGTRTIWLDRSMAHPEARNMTVINPTDLSALYREIEDHFQGKPSGGILLLDGFESVLGANEAQRVIRFLTMLRGSCARHGYSTMVPIAYRAVPQRVRNQLSEAMDTVVMD
jgi:hypothetical protein